MSLELQSTEASAIHALWAAWESATDSELEATFKSLDYTKFLDVIKYLRNLGLQEDPQSPKLNIMVAGGLRFTLVGDGVISAYCRDNTLKGKPFHVILKERKTTVGGASEVDLDEYGVRIKIRREHPLTKDDTRVLEALAKWPSLPKSFRHIKRYSFTSMHHKGIQFDASFVRENAKDARGNYRQSTTFTGAAISKQPVHYEMEVEALSGASQKSFMVGIASVLRGIQRSYVLTRNSVKQQIVGLMAAQTRAAKGRFPGAQPDTLRKAHIGPDPEPDTPHLPSGDYNVTDKADGLRCLMIVARNGRIYMVDRNLNVYGTDRRLDDAATAEWSGVVLDGEWITQDAENKPMSKYYAFDIFNGKRGEDVSARPFIVRSDAAVSRLAAMTEAIAVLSTAGKIVTGIPAHHTLSIHMKTFQTAADPKDLVGIFKESASVLDRVATEKLYHTDGLIFTPNAAPLAKNISRWRQQFKWKPAAQNSVDFLVVTEKERGMDGKPTNVELVSTRLRDDDQQIVRYKTLRLFVGSATDPAFVDPRDTILNRKPYPASTESSSGDYRPVEFSPSPPDPMASVCFVAINAGATDAAGAAPEAQAIAALDDTIYCDETKDPIASKTIVEMIYDPKKPAGWRWMPLRVRWDKTEKFARRDIGGTLNSEDTANDTWLSIHDPITDHMIRTGSMIEEAHDLVEGTAAGASAYYQRKASQRDLYKIRGLSEFHNRYIKENTLLRTIGRGSAVIDMSAGQAGDIHKWARQGAGFVLGCDIALSGITDNKNGAYRRYLNKVIQTKGSVPPMIFVQADSSTRYADGSAGQSPLDRVLLRTLWGENEPSAPPLAQELRGAAANGFDVASLMFSLHYFFKDRSTLDGFLRNVSETVKVGGYFVGCCFDGDTVSSLLKDLPLGGTERGNEDASDIWSITKKYDDNMGILSATDEGLGKAIDVNFISIGEAYTEYLVSWPYFVNRAAEIGLDLLNPDEMGALGLSHSTAMFSETHRLATEAGNTFVMSPTLKKFSFLNRWFIFRRRSTGTGAPMSAPTMIALPIPVPVQSVEKPVVQEQPVQEPVLEEPVVEEPVVQEQPVEEQLAEEQPVEEAVVEEGTFADGPIYQFYHKSGAKDELKLGDKHWRRYLSTFAPYKFRDNMNPDITYSSLEAVLGAAKYQLATNKPELGQQIFSDDGDIHQKIEAEKRALGALSADQEAEFIEKEGSAMRDAQKPAHMKKVRATWNDASWLENRERILTTYLRQRYEGDAKFRTILTAITKQKARLAYYTAGGTTELSGTIDADTIKGENLYGRALMRLAGLRY